MKHIDMGHPAADEMYGLSHGDIVKYAASHGIEIDGTQPRYRLIPAIRAAEAARAEDAKINAAIEARAKELAEEMVEEMTKKHKTKRKDK